MSTKLKLLLLAVAMAVIALTGVPASAATMSASLTEPTVDGEDIANYGSVTGSDKWWNDAATSGRPKGQTFTTSSDKVWLNSIAYRVTNTAKAEPTKTYVIRVGTVYGSTFTEIYNETATQTFTWNSSEYMTWTFDSPVLLAPGIVYGIDIGMTYSSSAWQTGIPYIDITADEYAGGTRYMSGTTGLGIGDSTMNNMTGDRIFHIDMDQATPADPGYHSPANGETVGGGDVNLSWTNLPANVGSDVWVDVWFGTDPVTDFTKVVSAGLNTTSVVVSAPSDGRYYWRIDSYLEGSPTGDPVEGMLLTFYVDDSSELNLIAALNALEDHITGVAPLSGPEIAAHKATIDTNRSLLASRYNVMVAAFALVETYDIEVGPLFVLGSPVQSFTRSSTSNEDINWAVYNVMQYIMDYTYTAANIASHEALLDGFKFGTSDFFPGHADPPADPNATYTVSIDGSYLEKWGHDTMYTLSAARKPTGAYLAPGSIATITVPSSIVGKGYSVRVCAHSWDFSAKPTIKRLDRSSLVYLIDSTVVKVASPLGGGIYIQVPYLQDAGVVSVQIKNTIRSPYFSAKSFHTTTLSEWQNVERNHPGPWADFQSEKYILNVPTDWIYNYNDPVTMMQGYDNAMDAMNDLMGYPAGQTKETMYPQIDLFMKNSVYAPGYPSVNATYNPNTNYGGNVNYFLLTGAQYAADYFYHEEGHAYLFQKFAGESESNVNLHHVAVLHQKFGYDLDYAFRTSRGYSNTYMTLDTTAIEWMVVFNFSFYKAPMASAEKAYQLKGHAKFVDIARLFGWQVLNDFWYSFNWDYENSNPIDTSEDGLMLRLAKCVGVDIRPLFHFWGMHPVDPNALAAAIAAENLQPSPEILATLVHYKSLVPADNAAFQAYALAWWQHIPSISGNWTEREHTRQWDTTNYWVSNGWDYCGTDPNQADGEIYTEATCARIKAVIDELIALYFPDADPPTPNPATFASAPAAVSATEITMTATTGSDATGPVEYYFDETTGHSGGSDSGWTTNPVYNDTGLTAGTQYTYTVQMRDALLNTGTASSPASATTPQAVQFVAAGAVKSGTGSISPALPSGIAVNDILLLFVETANQAVSISNQNGGTWAAVTNSPQGTGTAGGTTATRLTVFWSRYNGTQGAPTVSDSGNHQLARMVAVRGAVSSGDPWDVTAGGVEATSDTSASIPGATTTVANTLVVVATAGSLPDASGTSQFSAWTNANLTSLTERTDNSVNAGNGGSLGIATGTKATAGAYGNTAATHANSAVKGMISIAIKP